MKLNMDKVKKENLEGFIKMQIESNLVDLRYKDGFTALILAAANGYTGLAKKLIEKGMNLDLQNNYGSTALMFAAEKGYTDLAKTLIEKGAKVDLRTNHGYTALMFAAANGHKDLAETLIKEGANVDLQSKDGSTALMFAAANGHKDLAETLIKEGANVDLQNKDGSAAVIAIENDQLDIAELIIKKAKPLDKELGMALNEVLKKWDKEKDKTKKNRLNKIIIYLIDHNAEEIISAKDNLLAKFRNENPRSFGKKIEYPHPESNGAQRRDSLFSQVADVAKGLIPSFSNEPKDPYRNSLANTKNPLAKDRRGSTIKKG